MRIRVLSVAILILAIYLAFGDQLRSSQAASAENFFNGVLAALGNAVQNLASTFGRALNWG